MIRLGLDLSRLPLSALVEIGGRTYRLLITRNYIGGYPVLRLEDPRSGRLIWVRPLHYAMDALYGFCAPGAEGYGIVALSPSRGISGYNAEIFQGVVPIWLVPGIWKGHTAYPAWRVEHGGFVEEKNNRGD